MSGVFSHHPRGNPTVVIALAVIVVLVALCAFVLGRAFQRWKYPPKPRRRDYTPVHIQKYRMLMAALKRVRRGLRFPTVAQKKEHARFKKWLMAQAVAR